MAAAVQRIAIEAERHRFTFRQTRRTVPITFSMILVQASERRSSFGPVVLQLAVCAPAPVTRFPGPAPGACFAGSHSPWPPPFAPPAPQPVARLCSSASSLLWRSLTSLARSPLATAPRLPNADQMATLPLVRPGISRFPPKELRHMPGSSTPPSRQTLAIARLVVLPSAFETASALGMLRFRGSMAGLCPPLPTLRRRPCERQRTAWGRCGSLVLHRIGLSPITPCRSPGALRIISGGLGKLVGPSVDDGMAIDVVDAGDDALLEFVL